MQTHFLAFFVLAGSNAAAFYLRTAGDIQFVPRLNVAFKET